jgi:hypothetical protein
MEDLVFAEHFHEKKGQIGRPAESRMRKVQRMLQRHHG